MTARRRPDSRPLLRPGVAALAATLALAVSGCVVGRAPGLSDASAQLARLAEQQRQTPVRRAMDAPPAPGLPDAAVAPLPEGPRAKMSLAQALAEVVEPPTTIEPAPPAPELREQALRRYIAGRSARLSGDLPTAVENLEEAARLDPTAGAPWRELAETHLARGDRLAAAAAYRRALQRDPDDVRSLVRVGLWALDRRQPEQAATRLGAAWPRLDAADPALRHVVGAALGRALRDLGYLAAGVEASRRGLQLPEPFPAPTTYSSELQNLYRGRSGEWRDVGDAQMRLGRYQQALEAYERASSFDSLDPGALLPRKVHASMRIGAPAEAARAILEDLRAANGAIEARHLPLISHVRRYGDVGAVLAAGIEELAQSLPAEERRIAAGRIVRAQAAASPPRQAAALLQARLRQAPTDRGALVDLLSRVEPRGRSALVTETVRLISDSPLYAGTYTEGLLRIDSDARALLGSLDDAFPADSGDPAAALLESRLLLAIGQRDQAESVLRDLLASRPDDAPGIVAMTELLAEAGRREEALQLLTRLEDADHPEIRFARAAALRSLRRPADALAELRPLLDEDQTPNLAPGRRVDALLLAADLAGLLGDPEDAERWLQRAATIDPSQEQVFAGLISLYVPEGPLADQERLGETVRRLRQAAPSSRTLRWLRAQELTAAGRYDRAEEELLSLAEEELTQPIVDLLTTIWLRTGSADRAEVWLAAQRQSRPNSAAPVLALARVYAETDRAEEAVDVLERWLDERPADVAAARRLESILRDPLGRVDEADRLAMERLENEPPSVERALEFVPILVRQTQAQRAADQLLEALASGPPLTATQRRDFANAVLALSGQAIADEIDPEDARRLHDIAQERFDPAPYQLHASRLNLLAMTGAEDNALLEALAAALEDAPGRVSEFTSTVGQPLLRQERQDTALLLLDYAGEMTPEPEPGLLFQWFQLAVSQRNADSARRALRRIAEEEQGRQIMQAVRQQRFRTEDEAIAELAFLAAGSMGAEAEMRPAAESMYELALEFDPDHVMANNNLGYSLAERDERLEEARVMIERAYRQAPGEASVVDSMGWVLYKFGRIADETNARGEVIEPGAVTLLRRAAEMLEKNNQPDPIVFDHLGDALWRLGERDQARARWITARSLFQTGFPGLQNIPAPERQDLFESLRRKIEAAESGGDPPVAGVHGPLNVDAQPDEKEQAAGAAPPARGDEPDQAPPTGGAN